MLVDFCKFLSCFINSIGEVINVFNVSIDFLFSDSRTKPTIYCTLKFKSWYSIMQASG